MLAISRATTDENRPQLRLRMVSSARRTLDRPVWPSTLWVPENLSWLVRWLFGIR